MDMFDFKEGKSDPLNKEITMLKIRRDKRYKSGIILHISPLKHMLPHIIRTVSQRRF